MSTGTPTLADLIVKAARAEHEAEQFRAAVEAEKARLRAQDNRTLTQRFLDSLPFRITWRT